MVKKIGLFMSAMVLTLGVLTGCSATDSSEDSGNVELETGMAEEFVTAIKEAYGEVYLPDMILDEATFAAFFGIDTESMEEVIAEVPMISTFVDTLIVIEAVDGKAEEVESGLLAYKEQLQADTMQYPMNLAKIEASEVVVIDNYVFFIMLGAVDEESTDEAEQLTFAQDQIQIGLDVINEIAGK